jgi:hypothetical protein
MFSSNTSAVSADANYIEDVFSTYLYTGNGSTQTITNGIDLSTKGGLVWVKNRSSAYTHVLVDTVRGTDKVLCSNNANAEQTGDPGFVTQFNTNGFAIGDQARVNLSSSNFASWTFRKQPKFFDVVTYTGNGSTQAISHNLGSVPGCIIVKNITSATIWSVWHRSVNSGAAYGVLNLTDAFYTDSGGTAVVWGNNTSYVAPTSTQFTVGSNSRVNTNGDQYVAYLFAHDAGGFGLTGTDNVISCGSLSGAGTTVNLGYEPQWILAKRTDTTGNWYIDDNMRGWPAAPGNDNPLLANTSGAEPTGFAGFANITSTGFTNNFNGDYIYIAIRRGPMKTPTTGTSVFTPTLTSATTSTAITVGFPTDSHWANYLSGDGNNTSIIDRLRGMSSVSGTNTPNTWLGTTSNSAESTVAGPAAYFTGANNTGWVQGSYASGVSSVRYDFRRAPGFFDVVCYTGDGVAGRTVTHNLGVAPEMMIVKRRNSTGSWPVYYGNAGGTILLDSDGNAVGGPWNDTSPTSSVFTVNSSSNVNASGATYVAYLFASCPGVSKFGSYTGTGTTLQINCGFTNGARFVLIRRVASSSDWYVWDSARGIVSGNDPYLLLNTTAAEVTNTDYVDTYSAGFEISSTAPAAINANGGSFVFLAIA